jgi:hypothetical protein
MVLAVILVVVLVAAALAVAAGALDGPRRVRRRVVVEEPYPQAVRETVVERQRVVDRDPRF